MSGPTNIPEILPEKSSGFGSDLSALSTNCRPDSQTNGSLMALIATGREYHDLTEAPAEEWQLDKRLLAERFVKRFSRLRVEVCKCPELFKRYRLLPDCDALNNVVLVLLNPHRKPLNAFLRKICFHIGGQEFDAFEAEDLETQITAVANLWGKRISHIGDKTFIPLCFASLHGPSNFLLLKKLYHADVHIDVRSFCECEFELWGDCYYFLEYKKMLHNAICQITYQTQFDGSENCKQGTNEFRLNFLHPLTYIFFWGPEKRKIKRILLQLEGHAFVDCTPDELEYEIRDSLPDAPKEVNYIQLSEGKPFSPALSAIDASRIQNMTLSLECDEMPETDIFICAINWQHTIMHRGLAGLSYSK